MSVTITVLRCTCGKIHCCAGVGPDTLCACGRRLWPLLGTAGR